MLLSAHFERLHGLLDVGLLRFQVSKFNLLISELFTTLFRRTAPGTPHLSMGRGGPVERDLHCVNSTTFFNPPLCQSHNSNCHHSFAKHVIWKWFCIHNVLHLSSSQLICVGGFQRLLEEDQEGLDPVKLAVTKKNTNGN